MPENLPLIVDLHRGSTEDGPGVRTTIFFKGCPLACEWCQNPETIFPHVEIGFYPSSCIDCGDCVEACLEEAISKETETRIDRSKCVRCGRCTEVCPSRSLRRIGRYYEIDTLMEILLRDRLFYETSGGGLTLGGGEPALWPHYCGELLRKLKYECIHTAIQTCGYFEYSIFKEEMLPWLDLIMYDLKIIDPVEHLRHTGRDNQKIFENLLRLSREDIEITPRIPLIPGFTASNENLTGISEFLKENGIRESLLLPYNPLGLSKWERLGKARPALPSSWMQRSEGERFRNICSISNS